MLVPILHSLCVKLANKNSREVKTLLGTSVRQLGHGERNLNASHSLSTTSGGEHHPLDGSTSMVQWCVRV